MGNLQINKYFFHGIRSNANNTSFAILNSIFKSKFILTNTSLNKQGIFSGRESFGYQGNNAISICLHPNNPYYYNEILKRGIVLPNEENAFDVFVNVNNPSVILKESVADDLNIRLYTNEHHMPDELQITENIPLDYMIAIGYGNILTPYIESAKTFLNNNIVNKETLDNIYKLYKLYEFNQHYHIINNNVVSLNYINMILESLKIKVPVVNPLSGTEYNNCKNEVAEINNLMKQKKQFIKILKDNSYHC